MCFMATPRSTPQRRLHLEALESRTAPSTTPWLTENFDLTPAGTLPSGWSQWEGGNSATVGVAASAGIAGGPGLDIAATTSQATANAWVNVPSANVVVSAAVDLNSLIPAQVVARGSNLASAASTYYALSLTRGLDLQLVAVVNGATTVLADLKSAQWFSDEWVQATLQVDGNTLNAQVVRLDTGQYLNSAGQWQTAQTSALQTSDTSITQGSQVGLARPSSYVGTLQFDNFTVNLLAAATSTATTITENFDNTAIGSLPSGWAQYSSNGSNAFAVGNTVALSPPNSLAVTTATSSLSASAWLTATQPANVTVSAAILLNGLIPAQILARGSALNTTAPTYYALEATRGLDLQLLRVVNGTTTVLANLNSAGWLDSVWVSATLQVNGSTVQAQLVRTDTGQYLNSAGQWQSGQAWALTTTDTAITQAGLVGLGRPASYTGTVNFDDFAVTPVAAPAPSLTATPWSSTQINLSWTAVAGATGYLVDEWINGAWSQLAGFGSGTTSDAVTGLSPNTTYFFQVAAYSTAGTSWAPYQCATTSVVVDHPEAATGYTPVSAPLFGPAGPSYLDVVQGNLGDCWLVASLAEVAAQDPADITSMFTYEGTTVENGATVGLYSVRFYNSAGVAEYVTVDTELPSGGGYYDQVGDNLWAALAEKAYAQANGLGIVTSASEGSDSYNALNVGDPTWALSAITGKPTSDFSINPTNIAAAWNAGQLIVLNTTTPASPYIVPSHSYAVVGYNASSSQPFQLYNPWGIGSGDWALATYNGQQVYGLFNTNATFVAQNFSDQCIGTGAAAETDEL
jgi:hypothetical protein